MKTLIIGIFCLVVWFLIWAKVWYSVVENISINAVQDTLTQSLSWWVSWMWVQAEQQLNQFIQDKKEEMKNTVELKLKEYFNNKISNMFN